MPRLLLILLLTLVLCTACKSPTLSVDTDYFSRNDLASVIVDTPDPNKQAPIFGQRVHIKWSLTKKQFAEGPVELDCQILLKRGQMITKKIPITEAEGSYIIPIIGQDFTKNGGLLSYQIKLESRGKLLATSRHKFWVDPIKISD